MNLTTWLSQEETRKTRQKGLRGILLHLTDVLGWDESKSEELTDA